MLQFKDQKVSLKKKTKIVTEIDKILVKNKIKPPSIIIFISTKIFSSNLNLIFLIKDKILFPKNNKILRFKIVKFQRKVNKQHQKKFKQSRKGKTKLMNNSKEQNIETLLNHRK